MTAIVQQHDREVRITANMSLKNFLSEDRADMFGLEVPQSHESIEVNGDQARSWEQIINDGDRIIIKETDAVGTESIAPAETANTVPHSSLLSTDQKTHFIDFLSDIRRATEKLENRLRASIDEDFPGESTNPAETVEATESTEEDEDDGMDWGDDDDEDESQHEEAEDDGLDWGDDEDDDDEDDYDDEW